MQDIQLQQYLYLKEPVKFVARVTQSCGEVSLMPPAKSSLILKRMFFCFFSYKELSPLVSVLVIGEEPHEQTFVSPQCVEATDETGSNQPTGFRRAVCWEMYDKRYYHKISKKIGTPKIITVSPKKLTVCLYNTVVCPKAAERMPNSVDPDQTAL